MQALKSGQIPADLNVSVNRDAAKTDSAEEDKMITDGEEETTDEAGNTESEQNNDAPEAMEQVM